MAAKLDYYAGMGSRNSTIVDMLARGLKAMDSDSAAGPDPGPEKPQDAGLDRYAHLLSNRPFVYFVDRPANSLHKDRMRRKLATVAIGMSPDGRLCRGISVCSDLDNFDRKKGVRIACRRLNWAMWHKWDSEPLSLAAGCHSAQRLLGFTEWYNQLATSSFSMNHQVVKSDAGARLLPVEKALLDKALAGRRSK